MPSNSKSYRRKKKKSKYVHKQEQQLHVEQPTRNWLDLPSDLTVNILKRLGGIDILDNAQKVCTAWREICKDPAMWRVVDMENRLCNSLIEKTQLQEMCKNAVDRSQGQLVDLTLSGYCSPELLQYVADRSSQLRRLEILWSFLEMWGGWSEALKKLPTLEELSIVSTYISQNDIEDIGRCCPLLKTLKVNHKPYRRSLRGNGNGNGNGDNEVAFAIGKHLPELTHLELLKNGMTNIGLEAVLDGCCHLESLDLRGCWNVDLKGDLGKRCSQQIKYFHYDSGDVLDRTSDDDWAKLENMLLG